MEDPKEEPFAQNAVVVDPQLLLRHIEKLLPLVIDYDGSEAFSTADAIEKAGRFCADSQTQVLYIVKEKGDTTEGADEGENEKPANPLSLGFDLTYSPKQIAAVAVIKRYPYLDATRSLQQQLQITNLPGPGEGGNPYEILHSYIHNAISPFFDAFAVSKNAATSSERSTRDEKEGRTGIPMAKKKIAELELSLLQLQQNVEIPDVVLNYNPIVQRTVDHCHESGKRVNADAVGDLVDDSAFLNRLQADVNGWIKEIQKVTKLNRDPSSGTANQEISFWLNLERSLNSIEEQLRSDQVVLTLDILKHAKRFHATVSFLADTGLKEAMERVQKYNILMKDFPLNELLAATDLRKIQTSLGMIFGHLTKKLKLSPYPIRRALPLVEGISQDLNDQLLRVLNSRRLMYMDYAEFERIALGCDELFRTWDEQVKEFTNVARDLTRKRSEKFLPIKLTPMHVKLQERIKFIHAFRKQHEQLYETIVKVMRTEKGAKAKDGMGGRSASLSDGNALDDVRLAYDTMKTVDVLDLTPDGTELWVSAESSYNDKVARVENQIIARLRDRLGTAKNANEMFRVFSKFNALFVRPKIRGAIQEYQTQLIDSVKEDIKKLHDKFKMHYSNSEAHKMSQLRDLPPVAGAIVWARQIERQLGHYMKRVEDVLGRGWELYAEGQKLQMESTSFKKKLETRPIYDAWLADILKRDVSVTGRIFTITKNRAQGNALQLAINFDGQAVDLFKEVRNLIWLNFQVPHTITSIAKDAKRVHPFAVSLTETVRTYLQTLQKVDRMKDIPQLVVVYRRDIHALISKGIQLRWDFFVNVYDVRAMTANNIEIKENRHVVFVRDFASTVSLFHDKANAAVLVSEDVQQLIKQLEVCPFELAAFQELLGKVQKLIDQLNIEGYSNLRTWTQQLNDRIESVLSVRLDAAMQAWISAFVGQKQDAAMDTKRRKLPGAGKDSKNVQETDNEAKTRSTYAPNLETLVHEIILKDQVMSVSPPIEEARKNWIQQLHSWLANVCSLTFIQSSTYDMAVATKTNEPSSFAKLLHRVSSKVEQCYDAIELKTKELRDYCDIWLQYQSLWDLESFYVFEFLGDNLRNWQQLVLEVKRARSTFDTSETSKSFGWAVVDYEQVQSKVNTKYDQWQREILSRFGAKLGTSMRSLFDSVAHARTELEQHAIDGSSTSEAVTFITFLQSVRKNVEDWADSVSIFKSSQRILERQRFQFPNDWLYYDNIEGEWGAFNEILRRKNDAIRQQIGSLQQKIIAEDKSVTKKIKELAADWEERKPVQGQLKPAEALALLNLMEVRVTRIKDEYDQVYRAKDALDLDRKKDPRLEIVLEELRDLKEVWTSLSTLWSGIGEIRETHWNAVAPRKIRQQLDRLLLSMKEMGNRVRQYAAFDYARNILQRYLDVNSQITELRSDAVKERHWKQLFRDLGLESQVTLTDLTIGHLWDIDLRKNELKVRDVLTVAQGEMALEVFLNQVKETWSAFELELVAYQNKYRLIKGWDDLFAKCSENLNSLVAMRHSPYFRVFEEEALGWQDKLTRVQTLFDVWIDVQRQWVYLDGIFSNNVDIKHLLPVESARFQSINTEFMTLMKKVYKSPFVLDVLNIPGVQKAMDRLADLLVKIQKALGEYLERERSAFPRFYFVGDEDLLELLGNSKDIIRLQKHLKMMFAGISSLILSEDTLTVEGIKSKEGESLSLVHPISIKDNPRIIDWLKMLEHEMQVSLATHLSEAVAAQATYCDGTKLDGPAFLKWIQAYPDQLVVLGMQILWTKLVEDVLRSSGSLAHTAGIIESALNILADLVLEDLELTYRRKCEHLITELVHQRDVIRTLLKRKVTSHFDFQWLYHMRFYFDPKVVEPMARLSVRMANAKFSYGFEYLGITDRLVQTPLTDRCYLTLTQALAARLGGSPFGPAGTGKTESVKALGTQLGRFVLVFCCDENFDFQAMGRIFIGLCRVGAWGCFDEFNRLEERILSAVSQQVQTIQLGLKSGASVELVSKLVTVDPNTGIFITMNPGYAGRSNLPDNLKKLFRSVAMTKPDRELIAQVMLFSQGFRSAELLASKVVPLFVLCAEQLSAQSHYDFGLRSLKSVLISAGNLKREALQGAARGGKTIGASGDVSDAAGEQYLLIRSIRETMVPKLVAEDITLLHSLLEDVFPGINYSPFALDELQLAIKGACAKRQLVAEGPWLDKVIQLYQIHNIHHGLMMVGPSGSGKSTAHQVLLEALQKIDGIEGVSYVIDPKAMSKESLYGNMDSTTREWHDGLFTQILRRIVDNVRGEAAKRHWIIFDGDVDPEWVENLNAVLDDNKMLTLPNGERLNLPPNVRIMFEVENLKQATLATVSRCGMVWFSDSTVDMELSIAHYMETLRTVSVTDADDTVAFASTQVDTQAPALEVQRIVADILSAHMQKDGLVHRALRKAEAMEHIMDFTRIRALKALFGLINSSLRNISDYNLSHPDFPLTVQLLEDYITKRLLLAILWSFTGDSKLETKIEMATYLRTLTAIDLPGGGSSLIDFDVDVATGEWIAWQSRVPTVEIETHNVSGADVVIPTVDTVRHEETLYSWLSEHKPLILCGPPGSGKTMTLFSALRKLPEMEVVGLNFSSATTPELIMRTFEQHCEYRKTPSGTVLAPLAVGRWLVFFCDEINLPAADKYGTQRVISFIRQLVEHGGFWRRSDHSWVRLERIQFVGACNPPTDPGRVPLSHRFLRHAPVLMVDYPGEASLLQIYGTFNRAMLRVVPSLRGYSNPLTAAMVEFYLTSQKRFTPDMQAHYMYSPRELTRWVRGIFEAIKPLESMNVEGLVRIWAHEGLRLFQDRLVEQKEREWTDKLIDTVAGQHFPGINSEDALSRPILFSNWLSKDYVPVAAQDLRVFVQARLKVFYEEELDVPLVLFDDVLEHVLRIDRVYRQMQGHLLLIGISGAGKTTLARFVAWMNGLSVFQIKVHNKYSDLDFDEDLRTILRRAGCKGEKVCFIMDESNVLESGFLEKMNTLLANAEIPGLFEGDELASVLSICKETAHREGTTLTTAEETYKWFTTQIMKNLHVVFTMNPPQDGLASRAATSPALFNRCVLDWFGDWSNQALYQVGQEFTHLLDIEHRRYEAPLPFPIVYEDLAMPPIYRDAVINAFVFVHRSLRDVNERLLKRQGRVNFVTPRHYLDFINHYVELFREKREDLEDRQRHLNVGLDKLKETVTKVEELRISLASKRRELEVKNKEANEKLQRMVAGQQEAEQKKQASLEIRAELERQNCEIDQRRDIVLADLAEAEPAVLEAQNSVSGIKKQHLQEVRTMSNPPEAVKMAMESVCILLGNKIDSWKAVQQVIRKDDFIPSIVNFDTDKMNTRLREEIEQNYLTNPKFNFETVNRASQACGPLVQWAIAQVKYSGILERVGPLRREVQQLEAKAEVAQQRATAIEAMIHQLEESIGKYKEEYAVLISETQSIKTEMETVRTRVDRSLRLLDDLSSERERWESGSQTFGEQMATIVGDVLISAAFIAYAGFFSQEYRSLLVNRWTQHLKLAGINFREELFLPEYLSTVDERIDWQTKSLPADGLCTENAIMLKRFNRYPLLIDPSGQATTFLTNHYKERRLTITSFLDDSFLKVLESALRFGNPLLVQDVEYLDPILNAVLNKELRRTGGRVLIRLGGHDIDFSPSFTLFLSTRDASANFSPDLCSRVTFVNFTVTRESLQSQCLHEVLKAERPDTDQKRTDLIKLQGEFQLKLRHLEKSLLKALNDSEGNILEDDHVITTLETLKLEAAEVTCKVRETETIAQEVEHVTNMYTPLAQACSAIFFIMERMSTLNRCYQFSLEFFLEIFRSALYNNSALKDVRAPTQRLPILTDDLFTIAFRRVSRALVNDDRLVLAILLARLKSLGVSSALRPDDFTELYGSIHQGGNGAIVSDKISHTFGDDMGRKIAALCASPRFVGVRSQIEGNISEWTTFLQDDNPEVASLKIGDRSTSQLSEKLDRLLIVKHLRPDRLIPAAAEFVQAIFGGTLELTAEHDVEAVIAETDSSVPVVLCSAAGYDASDRVEALAAKLSHRLSSIAMGSSEGAALAEAALSSASRSGHWVLLKNVHLAIAWLCQLEKRLQSLKSHTNFKLFLTMEPHPKVPTNLLRMSRVLMFESLAGIKANVSESFSSIASSTIKAPSERLRLHFLLSWLDAVVKERMRYVPLGWSKTYDFNDADQSMALNVIDDWVDSISQGRANIAPENIPWEAIRTILKETVYGGKIDNDFDQRLLDTFVDRLFTPSSYNVNFALVDAGENQAAVPIPDGIRKEQFTSWIKSLPTQQPPSWLGLPNNAEMVVMAAKGADLLSNVRKLATIEEDESGGAPTPGTQAVLHEQAAWSKSLRKLVDEWLSILPSTPPDLTYSKASAADPLFRFFHREITIGKELWRIIRDDLSELRKLCEGQRKQTNHLRSLTACLLQGSVPQHWQKHKFPKRLSSTQWIHDFVKRLEHLNHASKSSRYHELDIWIGGFFMPEAFITATRQSLAHVHKCSLEELQLDVGIVRQGQATSAIKDETRFVLTGLGIDGADWAPEGLVLSSKPQTRPVAIQIQWIKKGSKVPATGSVVLPVYVDEDRSATLFTASLPCKAPSDALNMIQRSVAILANIY
ncbi:dynein heavy chain [Fimicolochytrium jonesii]|uniref:dynein heavy chain n=1 Tax=Fimicolochytrium jonesii TaxID=1396493 RepID=UPI0022FDDBC6|nr:dynein heavy chain [Fimicolochytrium jonesii]KAI8818344.1 dynein heavy chain [Fimicolochytrium jonesii]